MNFVSEVAVQVPTMFLSLLWSEDLRSIVAALSSRDLYGGLFIFRSLQSQSFPSSAFARCTYPRRQQAR